MGKYLTAIVLAVLLLSRTITVSAHGNHAIPTPTPTPSHHNDHDDHDEHEDRDDHEDEHDNDRDDRDGKHKKSPSPSPKPTSTPTVAPSATPSATPTVVPVPTNDPNDKCTNIDGVQNTIPEGWFQLNTDSTVCRQFQYGGPQISNSQVSDPQGQVLGASTMAGTGSFAETFYQAIMGIGGTLTAVGVKGLKKNKKDVKKTAPKKNSKSVKKVSKRK